jgi:hypothetical protein
VDNYAGSVSNEPHRIREISDRGRQVAALIVGVLLQDRERKAKSAMPLLKAIEDAVSLAEPAHCVSKRR